MVNTTPIQMPVTTVVDGRTWRLFGLNYTTADGDFSTYLYALSSEHAAAIVEELKQSASIGGEIQGWVDA